MLISVISRAITNEDIDHGIQSQCLWSELYGFQLKGECSADLRAYQLSPNRWLTE